MLQIEVFPVLSFALAAFIAGLSATLPPDPIMTMTISEAARRDSTGGFLVIVGHAIVEVIVVLVLLVGLGPLLGSAAAKIVIGLLGGFALVWMGYDLFKAARRKTTLTPKPDVDIKVTRYGSVTNGVVAAVANPYFVIWWVVIGGAFILQGLELLGPMGPIVFLLCHWASDFPWLGFLSLCVGKGKRLLTERAYRTTIGICGIFLIALGSAFVWNGVRLAMGW